MIETDLFEFAYVPDWYGQLEQLAEMALPEAWRFRKPQTECKNTDTPILERYLHMMFRKLSIDYNTGEMEYFHVENNCACFHMEKAIILLDEVKESIINAYETKSHLSRNKIAKLMSDETWLNAKKAHEMGFVDGILFAEKKNPFPPEEEEENPDKKKEDEDKEDSLTAMTYSKSRNLSAFLSKVSASAESVTGIPIDQLEKRLALLKY